MEWLMQMKRCFLPSSPLYEVRNNITGLVMTYGCISHCQAYVRRIDPYHTFTIIRRTKL